MNDKVDFIEAACGYVMEALEVLAQIIRDEKATAATRLRAITLLLDRAIGRQSANAGPRSAAINRLAGLPTPSLIVEQPKKHGRRPFGGAVFTG
jgi:hypothetical protein